jgi:uncharacterized protein
MSNQEVIGKVSRIAYYPLKSAGMVEVQSARLTRKGISGDRELMAVRATPDRDGVFNFVSQPHSAKTDPERQGVSAMARIKPQVIRGFTGDDLMLTWEGQDGMMVPPVGTPGRELPVRVWDDVTPAVDLGDEAAEWLTDHLKVPTRLVRAAGSFHRIAGQSYMSNHNEVNFQDAYPVHWFTQESLDELSARAGQDFSWTRFRPNMVVNQARRPQVEHELLRGEVAGIPFRDPKPNERCLVTTTDQETEKSTDTEPLKTLGTYMRWRSRTGDQKIIFGENMLPESEGEIKVGDEVVLIERRAPALFIYGPQRQSRGTK